MQLLADCRRIFAAQIPDRLPTETLVQALTELDESPWADLRGKPLDARAASHGDSAGSRCAPATTASPTLSVRATASEDFHDAWQRYLPPVALPCSACCSTLKGTEAPSAT